MLSPTTVLNHEADHALDDIENPVEHNRNRKTSDANFDNKEERRVILGTETETAIKLGEIEKGQISRDDHSGYETRTSSPISKDTIFVNYPSLDEVEVIFEQSKCDEK